MSVSFCTATSDVSLLSGYDFANWLPAGISVMIIVQFSINYWLIETCFFFLSFHRARVIDARRSVRCAGVFNSCIRAERWCTRTIANA